MNLGKDFWLSDEDGVGVPYNGDPWFPVTPQTHVMWDSNPNPVGMLGNETNTNYFPELLPNCSRFLPENPMWISNPIQNSEVQVNQRASSSLETLFFGQSNVFPENSAVQNSDTIHAARQGNHIENVNWQNSYGTLGTFSPQVKITSSDPIASGTQGDDTDSTNWQDLIGVYSDLLQQTAPNDAFQNLKTDRLLDHGERNIQGNPVAEPKHHSASTIFLHQNQMFSPNQDRSSYNLQEMSSDAILIPNQLDYNLNLPPRTEMTEASTSSFQIAPLTPDQGNHLKNQKQQEITSTNMKGTGNNCEQLLQSVIPSASSNSTSLKEKNILQDGGFEGIDLNKTPEQKTPKRKKHRPKVVVEGKPKRTPKPTPLKTNISNETPSGKRRYVRKKDLKNSTSQQDNETKPVEVASVQPEAKSCRRALNFDNEVTRQDKPNDNPPVSQNESFDLNLASQETTSSMGLNKLSTITAAKEEQKKRYSAEIQQSGAPRNLMNCTNQKPTQKFLPLALTAPTTTARDHTLNVIARTINRENVVTYQSNEPYGYSQFHQQIHGGAMGRMPLQANGAWDKQLMLPTKSVEGIPEANAKRGYKRDHCNISDLTHPPAVNSMHYQLSGNLMNKSSKSGAGNSETHKKKKLEGTCHEAASNMPSFTATATYSSSQVECRYSSGVYVSSSPYTNGRLPYPNLEIQPYPNLEIQNSSRKQTRGTNGITNDQYMNSVTVGNKQKHLSRMKSQRDCMSGQFFLQHPESHSASLLTGITNRILPSPPQRILMTTRANETKPEVDEVVKSQLVGLESAILPFRKERVLPKDYKRETGYLPFSRKPRGQNEERKHLIKIDEIISQLKRLQISKRTKSFVREEQTALIPYKGDGTIVPYEGFNSVRRRKARPKVNLDPETNRLWNLLMVVPGSESTETMEEDKEKWWAEERRVFRGRVDSFIARMHLLQGDRRFSIWKGSVVDSVVGVFLTQNVSDHLSSSAFMSLAAEFPLQRTSNSTSTWTEEPEVQIIDPDGTITYHREIPRQPLYKHNSRTSCELSEQRTDHLIRGSGVHLVEENNRAAEDEVFSSQNSSESLILQANEDVQSSSDSEVEGQVIMCNANESQSPKAIQQTERAASLPQHQTCGIRNPLQDNRPISEYQKQPSPACTRQNSASNIANDVYGYPMNSNLLHMQGSFAPSNGLWLNKTSQNGVPVHCSSGLSARNSFSPRSYFRSSQQCISHDQEGSSTSFQLESASETNARKPDEAGAPRQIGHMHSPSEPLGSESTKIPNLRKKKLDEKTKPFDWDTLRKQALLKGGRQKRDKDKMDSLDYEALRHADIARISKTIKDRGMNNMLAERIKDFLNRVVRDHESIDLEWLRDVPPDKAKEYLLSIRGLGLKSVECVRLLTLHHMAFPVDTNVGRIAVRLGWVPLQPLPESLQLHLLELYPILESIQKYLWPRLCKLDQRTLYELHYQMITFGKVFCTKRNPNCNACPMRPECRHFASAFASARLALPGPEEKSIVSSAIPIAANGSPSVLKPMLLTTPETNVVRQSQYISGQEEPIMEEPIIEEPSTPEMYTGVSESDIEDTLSEETDEIPTIDLSLEQLKMNVKSILQERNMEITEGDLSRALVALTPDNASIPAPKLKNVSRLRTEHRVYEIPDSHPLLKGMDRREPDDPSPYLLAIWTPGETANSTEPPESTCSFQGTGRLCNEETCSACNRVREANSQTVRGTLLIPCRTAMRGSFPLNGTYFQVNEVFADHESSINPIEVPRDWLWTLPRRTVYFGTSVSTIFKGLSQIGIQYCFWRGFVCVRGFELKTRSPRPLVARLHFPASKKVKSENEKK